MTANVYLELDRLVHEQQAWRTHAADARDRGDKAVLDIATSELDRLDDLIAAARLRVTAALNRGVPRPSLPYPPGGEAAYWAHIRACTEASGPSWSPEQISLARRVFGPAIRAAYQRAAQQAASEAGKPQA